jgi:hypothetical protein
MRMSVGTLPHDKLLRSIDCSKHKSRPSLGAQPRTAQRRLTPQSLSDSIRNSRESA